MNYQATPEGLREAASDADAYAFTKNMRMFDDLANLLREAADVIESLSQNQHSATETYRKGEVPDDIIDPPAQPMEDPGSLLR